MSGGLQRKQAEECAIEPPQLDPTRSGFHQLGRLRITVLLSRGYDDEFNDVFFYYIQDDVNNFTTTTIPPDLISTCWMGYELDIAVNIYIYISLLLFSSLISLPLLHVPLINSSNQHLQKYSQQTRRSKFRNPKSDNPNLTTGLQYWGMKGVWEV